MKTFFLCIISLLSIKFSFAQTDTVFFDSAWNKCKSTEAKYYRLVKNEGNRKVATDYYLGGIPQMIAEISSTDPLIKDGKCSFFGEKGNKTSEGNYKNNKYAGVWTIWTSNGKDSSIVEYKEDGTKNYLRRSEEDKEVFYQVEIMPQFPGGQNELLSYIKKNLEYPKSARKDSIQGQVYVKFVIDTSGYVQDVKILKGVRTDIDEAALKVIKDMPKWTPGIQGRKVVNVQFTIPILFTLTASNSKK